MCTWFRWRTARGKVRSFPLGFGFLFEGEPVNVVPPRPLRRPRVRQRTASGSVKVEGQRARVARASRIWVEGKHDAELVEKVWGDDLRVEGIVVEPLHGVDDLAVAVADFPPAQRRRLASWWTIWCRLQEWRIAEAAMAVPAAAGNVLIVGHPTLTSGRPSSRR